MNIRTDLLLDYIKIFNNKELDKLYPTSKIKKLMEDEYDKRLDIMLPKILWDLTKDKEMV